MRPVQYCEDTSATVAWASATTLIGECYAGAPPDRVAELLAVIAPRMQACIHAYCEAMAEAWVLVPGPVPSRN